MEEFKERRKQCPYHSGTESRIDELYRMSKDGKEDRHCIWEAITGIRQDCKDCTKKILEDRTEDTKTMNRRFEGVPKTNTLIAIFTIVLTIFGFISGIWINSNEKSIKALEVADAQFKQELRDSFEKENKERKDIAKEVGEIKIMVNRLEGSIRKLK